MFTAQQLAPNLRAVGFGQEVRRRRQAAGLTLEQLAERCELTPNYVGTIEKGKRDPSLSTVIAIARGLKIAPADLVGGVKGLGPGAIEAARLFETLPHDAQEPILALLRALSRRRR